MQFNCDPTQSVLGRVTPSLDAEALEMPRIVAAINTAQR
jgi:hypothetical protein